MQTVESVQKFFEIYFNMKNKISLDSKVGTFSEQSLEGTELSAAAVVADDFLHLGKKLKVQRSRHRKG